MESVHLGPKPATEPPPRLDLPASPLAAGGADSRAPCLGFSRRGAAGIGGGAAGGALDTGGGLLGGAGAARGLLGVACSGCRAAESSGAAAGGVPGGLAVELA